MLPKSLGDSSIASEVMPPGVLARTLGVVPLGCGGPCNEPFGGYRLMKGCIEGTLLRGTT